MLYRDSPPIVGGWTCSTPRRSGAGWPSKCLPKRFAQIGKRDPRTPFPKVEGPELDYPIGNSGDGSDQVMGPIR